MRDCIRAIQALGVMPASRDADISLVKAWSDAVGAIVRPVTENEAIILMNALPTAADDFFGIAFSILHTCETAPRFSVATVSQSSVSGHWRDYLLTRLKNSQEE